MGCDAEEVRYGPTGPRKSSEIHDGGQAHSMGYGMWVGPAAPSASSRTFGGQECLKRGEESGVGGERAFDWKHEDTQTPPGGRV